MNIFYDYQSIFRQRFGGVTRYHYELYKALEQQEDISVKCRVYGSPNYYFQEILGYEPVKKYYGLQGIPYRLNRISNYMEIASGKYDIVHPTWYDEYCYNKKNEGKYVVTIHDMIHELFPECFAVSPEKEIAGKKFWIYNADKIIAVSENTKADILKLYSDIDESKITVVYHGRNVLPQPQKVEMDFGNYILYVGGRKLKYKNFENLVKGFKILADKKKIDKLVCAGGNAFTEDEKKLIHELELDDKIVQLQVSDGELAYLYMNAGCLVMPSLYEGFGFPILEAFECNCPVVLSNASCLPEVGGDAVLYFDPLEIEEIACKIENVLEDSRLRQNLVLKGTERKKEFSWKKAVSETLDVYKK